jgi:ankyrin repeat protein
MQLQRRRQQTSSSTTTGLQIAIQYDQTDIVKYLLHHYDNDDDDDSIMMVEPTTAFDHPKESITHLQYATIHNSFKTVEYFVSKKDTNVNETNNDTNWTALHFACYYGHVDVVKFLLNDSNANIQMKTSNGCTSLHLAARFGHLNVVQYLIDDAPTCADIDAESNDGLTALHYATMNGYSNVVQYLLNNGNANPGAQTKQGLTALHIAASNNSLEITRLLLKYPKSNTKNKKGELPLDYTKRILKSNDCSVYVDENNTNDMISLLQYHTLLGQFDEW